MKTKKHTTKIKQGMRLHKRIALHTSSILLVLGGGFLPSPFTLMGNQTLNVTARIAGQPPTDPAIITYPNGGKHFDAPDVTVIGTCPTDSYVKVFAGDHMAGVSDCASNAFSVPATLAPNANELTAKVYNTTDDEGPASPSVTVVYDAPAPPPQPSTSSSTLPTPGQSTPDPPTADDTALSITTPYMFAVHRPGEEWQWAITVAGGTPPNAATIDWGDGLIEHHAITGTGVFTIAHIYDKAGVFHPFVDVIDAAGHGASVQLLAMVRSAPILIMQWLQTLAANVSPWLIWPVYTPLIAGVVLFWWYEARVLLKHIIRWRGHA